MIVTAVMARLGRGAERVVERKPRGGLAKRLGDSKALVSHGDCLLGEAWARTLVGRGLGVRDAGGATPERLVDALSLDSFEVLTAPCPSHIGPGRGPCWDTAAERYSEDEEGPKLQRAIEGDLARLAERGVEITAVRSVIVCAKRLNEGIERGHSRFVVDLHAMERLVLSLREIAGEPVTAVCGKVGGFGEYGKVFGPLGGRLHCVLEEGRARSAYRFPGLGEIAFVRDGDASDILVGMASLVGKYLRELLMARIVRHYREHDPELEPASGYHDPITGRFIVRTEALRRRQRMPDECFERRRLDFEPS
jgi:hypothetical protein